MTSHRESSDPIERTDIAVQNTVDYCMTKNPAKLHQLPRKSSVQDSGLRGHTMKDPNCPTQYAPDL